MERLARGDTVLREESDVCGHQTLNGVDPIARKSDGRFRQEDVGLQKTDEEIYR